MIKGQSSSWIQTGYQVQRATVTGGVQGPWAPVGPVLGIGSTTYSDTSVAPATTYAYRVVASNAAGPSAPSNVVTVTTPQRPAAASNLTAMLAPGTRYVMLNWTINGTLATGFTITRTGGGGTATFTVAGSVASFVDTSVNAGFTYTYTVTAFDAAGNAAGGPPSASVTTPAVPGAPTSLATATVTATSAVLTWSAGSPGTQLGFYVWRSSNNGATWSLVGQTAGGSTLYPNTGLTTKTTYLFRVQAWNAFGLSGLIPAHRPAPIRRVPHRAPGNLGHRLAPPQHPLPHALGPAARAHPRPDGQPGHLSAPAGPRRPGMKNHSFFQQNACVPSADPLLSCPFRG